LGSGSGCSPGVPKTWSGLVSQRSGMDRFLSWRMVSAGPNAQVRLCVGTRAARSWRCCRYHPLYAEAGAGSRGARSPRRPQSVEVAPGPRGWRPVLAVTGVLSLTGIGAGAFAGLAEPDWSRSTPGPGRSGHLGTDRAGPAAGPGLDLALVPARPPGPSNSHAPRGQAAQLPPQQHDQADDSGNDQDRTAGADKRGAPSSSDWSGQC
jgi:hypothetical protein